MRSPTILQSHRRAPRGASAAVLAALVLSFAAGSMAVVAQGRSRGGAPPDQSAPPRPTVAPVLWEPEQIFPLAIARAGELHLTDQQRAQIETIASKLRSANAALLTQIDTLRPPRPDEIGGSTAASASPPPPPTADQIAAVVARRHALGEVRAQMHENTRLAREQLNALLTPDQQQRLASDENSARQSAERGDPGGSTRYPGAGVRNGRPPVP